MAYLSVLDLPRFRTAPHCTAPHRAFHYIQLKSQVKSRCVGAPSIDRLVLSAQCRHVMSYHVMSTERRNGGFGLDEEEEKKKKREGDVVPFIKTGTYLYEIALKIERNGERERERDKW